MLGKIKDAISKKSEPAKPEAPKAPVEKQDKPKDEKQDKPEAPKVASLPIDIKAIRTISARVDARGLQLIYVDNAGRKKSETVPMKGNSIDVKIS